MVATSDLSARVHDFGFNISSAVVFAALFSGVLTRHADVVGRTQLSCAIGCKSVDSVTYE
jgi:hypothetical protein